MIIQEHNDHFIMIRQHDHAIISEQMTRKLKDIFLPDDKWWDSVFYAIRMHDVGWENFDAAPIWNDETAAPYSFIEYPNEIKAVLYKHGIDEVAKEDLYAGLLCSKHYEHFLARDTSPAARRFVFDEKDRQQSIQDKLAVDEELVDFHFDLLRFADNLSLFLCLNKPGAGEDETHYFFKKGIRLPERVEKEFGERVQLEWMDEKTVVSDKVIFEEGFRVEIPVKKVLKAAVAEEGIRKSYDGAGEERISLRIER